jgi:hypothetical protein
VQFESIEMFAGGAFVPEADTMASACVRLGEHNWFGEELDARIVCSLASISLERMLCRDVPYWEVAFTTCLHDYSYADEQCEWWGFNIQKFQTVANKMVRRLNPIIRRLGDELLRRRRMTYEEVMQVCPEVEAEGRAYVAALPERQAQLFARLAARQKAA